MKWGFDTPFKKEKMISGEGNGVKADGQALVSAPAGFALFPSIFVCCLW
jgi:hypothetical protein